MSALGIALAALSLAIWLYLVRFRAGFWRCDQRLDPEAPEPRTWPALVAVVPARNEAATIGRALTSLLRQDYPASFPVIVVDDDSDDGTAAHAEQAAAAAGEGARLTVVRTPPLPPGWTGKLWALHQGLEAAERIAPEADFVLFSDADVAYQRADIRRLVAKAVVEGLDLASLMVLLHCHSQWERLLIPAFVFFFQKLYPFRRVNDPESRTAAAAGGSMLVRRTALAEAGGVAAIRGEIIDDCALARAVKANGPIWLGLSDSARSLRRHEELADIWRMVARTAYHQLGYSPRLLAATVLGMALTYLVPPLAALLGAVAGEARAALLGIAAWLVMMRCYAPTLRLYRRPRPAALDLPVAALLYTVMTLDSARRHRRGAGAAWKGRRYPGERGSRGAA